MARYKSTRRRGNYSTAKRSLPTRSNSLNNILREYEDRREWHPLGASRPARSFNRDRHRLVVAKYPVNNPRSLASTIKIGTVPHVIAFGAPKKVLICVRRKIREQVLHALKKTGIAGQNRPRRSEYSSISCKG